MLSLVYKRVDDSTESQRLSLTLVLGNQPDPRGSVYQPARTDFERGRSLLYLAREEAGRMLQCRDVTIENRILNYLFVKMTAELFADARQSQILSRSVLLSIQNSQVEDDSKDGPVSLLNSLHTREPLLDTNPV